MHILVVTDIPMVTMMRSPQTVMARSVTMRTLEVAVEPHELEVMVALRTTTLSRSPTTKHKHYRGLEAQR